MRRFAATIGGALLSVRLALSFLTILPVRFARGEVTDAAIARSRIAYPVTGLIIGLLLAGLSGALTRAAVNPGASAFLIVAAGALLTGGLHLDGLADSADGLFLGGDRARRLDVMRDPRVGSFGVIALVLVLCGKLAALDGLGGTSRLRAVLLAAIASRSLVLLSAGLAGYARPQGTGRVLVEASTVREAVAAGSVVLIAGSALLGRPGVVAGGLGIALALAITVFARRRIGGVTGDTLGAVVEVTELAVLLALGSR